MGKAPGKASFPVARSDKVQKQVKSISHRLFGFRSAETFTAAIYHCCAKLPLPVER
jgi:hypothetical protein